MYTVREEEISSIPGGSSIWFKNQVDMRQEEKTNLITFVWRIYRQIPKTGIMSYICNPEPRRKGGGAWDFTGKGKQLMGISKSECLVTKYLMGHTETTVHREEF